MSGEEIPPDIIRNIMLYCLDCYGAEGAPGKSGTSCTAMMFLSNWLDGYGSVQELPISSRYLSGPSVTVRPQSEVVDALRAGGVAVVRLYFDVAHYVLLTGVEEDGVRMFDPYYVDEPFPNENVVVTLDHPTTYNRIVPFDSFNREEPRAVRPGRTGGAGRRCCCSTSAPS